MRLHLKNIGKLAEADVVIDGITVIAGENDTGKSTVGKILYSVFNSFYDFEKQIQAARISLFSMSVKKEFTEKYNDYDINSVAIAEDLFNRNDDEITTELIENLIKDNIDDTWSLISLGLDGDTVKFTVSDGFIQFVLNTYYLYTKGVSDKTIYGNIFNRQIRSTFNTQIQNIYSMDECSILLEINHKSVAILIDDNIVKGLNETLSLKTEIMYIDNPFILDEWLLYTVNTSQFATSGVYYRVKLLQKLMKGTSNDGVEEALKEIIVSERIKPILAKIQRACSGNLEFKQKDGFSYISGGSTKNISINNISTGLKTFIILKTLLTNGSIEQNGTIILDEPEIHLHPEWQILFAEIIVLLQKEFNLHILLTTHSPYFLEAIEVYSEKYKINNKCKYYLADNTGDVSNIIDVTNNTEEIYKKLARPFQDLENARYSDD